MKLIRGIQNLPPQQGCVTTIGNFDGVHIGHQKIISRLCHKSKQLALPSLLISFMPSPQSFFKKPQAVLSNFKEKYHLLKNLGLNEHLLINFNKQFAQMSAPDFIQQILINKLHMKHCLIGDDFRFGRGREGNFELLQKYAKTQNFTLERSPSVLYQGVRVSSSKIRTLLLSSQFETVRAMLGREFSISGEIIHGAKQGRKLNFPTINIPIQRKISPILGVFALVVKLNKRTYQGVGNIGKRPTLNGEKILLEVFLFDFNLDVYGQKAQVIFKHKIRDEKKFPSLTALKQQIKTDSQAARYYFSKNPD